MEDERNEQEQFAALINLIRAESTVQAVKKVRVEEDPGYAHNQEEWRNATRNNRDW